MTGYNGCAPYASPKHGVSRRLLIWRAAHVVRRGEIGRRGRAVVAPTDEVSDQPSEAMSPARLSRFNARGPAMRPSAAWRRRVMSRFRSLTRRCKRCAGN